MQTSSLHYYSRCILMAAIILSLSACATVAELSGKSSQKMNRTAAQQYRRTVQLADARNQLDTASTNAQRVQTIFNRLIPPANRANQTGERLVWEVALIRSESLNAWSMPGGKIAIYSGLIETLNLNDDEIAAILGHEMAHVLHEDGKRAEGRKVLTRVASSTIGFIAGSFAQLGADVIGHYGIAMPYSRSQENRADETGMKLMAEAGYNPAAALNVWRKMSHFKNNNNLKVAISSSHPTNQARYENLRSLLPQMQPIYERNRHRFPSTPTPQQPHISAPAFTVQRLGNPRSQP